MKLKLSCPMCKHAPLRAEKDAEGWPKSLVCPQCNWIETDGGKCRALARSQVQAQDALSDPAERKRRQEADRAARNKSVLRSYRIKH